MPLTSIRDSQVTETQLRAYHERKILNITIKKKKDDINGPHLRIIKGSREPTSCHKKEKVRVLLFYPRIWPLSLN